jgi:hypothetical protein
VLHEYPHAAFIVGGDFNARTGEINSCASDVGELRQQKYHVSARQSSDKQINADGRKFLDFCETNNLIILNGLFGSESGKFTHINCNGVSVIDYVACSPSLLSYIASFTVESRAEANHMPLSVSFTLNHSCLPPPNCSIKESKFISKYKWQADKANTYYSTLDYSLRYFYSYISCVPNYKIDITFVLDFINKMISEAGSTMKVTTVHKNKRNNRDYWYDDECRELKRVLSRALRNASNATRPFICSLRKKYKSLKENKIEEWKVKKTNELKLIIESRDATQLWNHLRRLRGGNYVTNCITPDAWMQHFRKLLGGDTPCVSRIVLQSFRYDNVLDSLFTADELRQAIYSLKNNKASGSDGIPAEMLKIAACNTDIFQSWLSAFNAMYLMGVYYHSWETSIVHTIYKNKGSKEAPDNYRGIALAQILSKVYSKLLYERLKTWAFSCGKISVYQAGFRAGYSTIDNVFILDHMISKYLSYPCGALYCAFIDFEKAFDTVNRQKLWAKLYSMDCSTRMVEALMALYDTVDFSIKCGPLEVTPSFPSYVGVKQGCILSPLLFILYINDMINIKNVDCDTPLIGRNDEIPVPGLLYADDCMLCSLSVRGLQIALNNLSRYSEAADLRVHTGKTKIICFKNSSSFNSLENWTYQGDPIEKTRCIVYLGMCLAMSGIWNQHIKKCTVKAKKAVQAASSVLYKCIDPPFSLCKRLYESNVESVALYGAEIWGVNNNIPILTVQSSFYKRVLGVAKSTATCGLLKETGSVDIITKARRRALMYWLKCAKDLAPPLVAHCYREQLQIGLAWIVKPWLMKIKELMLSLGLSALWEGHGLNDPHVYGKITSVLYAKNMGEILRECDMKSSLRLLNSKKWGTPFYVSHCNRDTRSGLLWFWLGGIFVYKHMASVNGVSIQTCPLCFDEETVSHVLFHCKKTQKLRQNMSLPQELQCDISKIYNCDNICMLNQLGRYFNKVRTMRSAALQKLADSREKGTTPAAPCKCGDTPKL